MPDFQYQPPTGPLSGSEFERQTTRFFQQVQGAVDAAQSTAIAAQITANEAIERAQASNLVDGKTTRADAGGVITVKDVAIGGNLEDLASARGQIGPARELGNNVDFNTVTEAGLYLINATGSVNAPRGNQAFFLQVVRSVKGAITKNLFQIAYNYSPVADLVFIRQYRMASSSWSVWTQFITSSQVGDGLTVNNGIISVPEYVGATASAAGTSGLVPPAAAGQATYVLCGDGEYRDIATLVAAAQARLADKAAS
ncbi:pyocin knob domain-containing protein [Bilophila wadsworthia]|uniref:pyocin knob domain-containing protein n=1 Tax=Bilophila wadsworthia TaxID=35833 RepID=UPI0034CEE403